MKIGLLIEHNETNTNEHKDAKVGIEVNSLLEDIELALFGTAYDSNKVLQMLHQDLLVLAGRIELKKKED